MFYLVHSVGGEWACWGVNWRCKPEPREWSACGVLRAKPELRVPENWRQSPNLGQSPTLSRGGCSVSHSLQIFWKFVLETMQSSVKSNFSQWWKISQPNSATRMCLPESCRLHSGVCEDAPTANDFGAFKKNALYRRGFSEKCTWWSKYKPQFWTIYNQDFRGGIQLSFIHYEHFSAQVNRYRKCAKVMVVKFLWYRVHMKKTDPLTDRGVFMFLPAGPTYSFWCRAFVYLNPSFYQFTPDERLDNTLFLFASFIICQTLIKLSTISGSAPT